MYLTTSKTIKEVEKLVTPECCWRSRMVRIKNIWYWLVLVDNSPYKLNQTTKEITDYTIENFHEVEYIMYDKKIN